MRSSEHGPKQGIREEKKEGVTIRIDFVALDKFQFTQNPDSGGQIRKTA